MKVVSYMRGSEVRAGIVDGDVVLDAGDDPLNARAGAVAGPVDSVRIVAPIARPGKIVCAGLNYRDHAEESGQPIPESPILFAKFASSIIGPGTPIAIPSITTQADYEAELGVIIGSTVRAVTPEQALDYVFGYTCINDVSARDLQFADGQWIRGKSLDTFCPIGPWIVTKDEIPDPQTLSISCRVNGRVLQDSSTKQMIFSVAELISFISQGITLEPGDIIATGTPPGVGFARTPPIWLQPGDTVEVEIEGIGILQNPVVARS